ncbi:hypothetical protein DH2020_004558 [Rehmannia glutinosa]|uniref:Uncharacterized protein n=1 Tax=Rehmannia glutinosa TaxID=99300 RepID=A0ABR0XPU5_REHGL
MVMEVVHEDMGDGNMQCTNHPYKNSTPGGICALCLQEKLGKLVSSSFPTTVFPSTSSSPSPSFRSDFENTSSAGGAAASGGAALQVRHLASSSANSQNGENATSIVFKRSKSTVTPRRATPSSTVGSSSVSGVAGPNRSREKKREDFVVVDENGSPDQALDRKVSRSRSVGCGSRSFQGISLRGSQLALVIVLSAEWSLREKESQRYNQFTGTVRIVLRKELANNSSVRHLSHGRSKSWGWALASPMRAFGKPSAGKRDAKNVTPNLAAIPSLLAVSG